MAGADLRLWVIKDIVPFPGTHHVLTHQPAHSSASGWLLYQQRWPPKDFFQENPNSHSDEDGRMCGHLSLVLVDRFSLAAGCGRIFLDQAFGQGFQLFDSLTARDTVRFHAVSDGQCLAGQQVQVRLLDVAALLELRDLIGGFDLTELGRHTIEEQFVHLVALRILLVIAQLIG
jgi:hypothetical protein